MSWAFSQVYNIFRENSFGELLYKDQTGTKQTYNHEIEEEQ